MYIDYENSRVYFSKEQVDHIFKNNSNSRRLEVFSYVTDNGSTRLLLSSSKYSYSCNFFMKKSVDYKINTITNKLYIERTYFIDDFDFIATILQKSNSNKTIKIGLNSSKGPKYIIELDNKYVNPSFTYSEWGLLFDNIYCSAGRNIYDNVFTTYMNGIPSKYYSLNKLLTMLPYKFGSMVNSFEQTKLSKDALYIGYYLEENAPIYEVKYVSKHKFREIIYLIDRGLDYKHLLTETKNHLKVLSSMFDRSTALRINNTIREQLLEDEATFEIVKGADIKKYYLYENYYKDTGDLGNSCMKKKECQSKLDFYSINPNISMLVLIKEDKIIGRALLWKTKNNEVVMDRIYTCHSRHDKRFIVYAKTNNIEFIYDYNQKKGSGTGYSPSNFTFNFSKKFEVELSEESCQKVINEVEGALKSRDTSYKSMPYFDNFCFLDPFTKTISNVNFFQDLGYIQCSYSEKWFNPVDLMVIRYLYVYKKYCVTSTRGTLGLESDFFYINDKFYESEDVCCDYFSQYVLKEDCVFDVKINRYIHKNDIVKYIKKRGSFKTSTHLYSLDNLDNIVCSELPNVTKKSIIYEV